MTVQTTQFRQEFSGNDVTVEFPLSFPFIDRTHLVATRFPTGGGSPEVLTIVDSTGDSLNGGWGITLSAPVGTGYTLRVERVTPVLQPRPWTPNDKFPAKAHENAHDRAIMIIQEIAGRLSLGQFSTNPATFIEGLELVVGPALQPGQIGYATDSRVVLLKLQDGTTVRIPVDGGEEGLSGYSEGYHSEYSWLSQSGNILGNSAFIRGENNFSGQAFLDGATLVMHWYGVLPGLASPGAYVEAKFGNQSCGQFYVNPLSTGDTSIDYEVRIFCGSISSGKATLRVESSIRYSGNYAEVAAPIGEHTRVYDQTGIAADEERGFSLSVYRFDAGYIGGDLQQRGFSAFFDNIKSPAPAGAQLIGTAGGDLSGTYPAPSVVGLRGAALPALPSGRAILTWTGTAWELAENDPRPIVEEKSFVSGGKLVRDSGGDIWANSGAKGCFCWIAPCEGWDSIKYIRTLFPGTASGWDPRFAIWGWTGAALDSWVKLVDDDWNAIAGGSVKNALDIDLATAGYKWVFVASDPGTTLAPEWVAETGYVYPPPVTADPFPRSFGFVGARSAWLGAFGDDPPTILGDDPKYLVAKWMALGVQISAS